jgi:hypothetical protein
MAGVTGAEIGNYNPEYNFVSGDASAESVTPEPVAAEPTFVEASLPQSDFTGAPASSYVPATLPVASWQPSSDVASAQTSPDVADSFAFVQPEITMPDLSISEKDDQDNQEGLGVTAFSQRSASHPIVAMVGDGFDAASTVANQIDPDIINQINLATLFQDNIGALLPAATWLGADASIGKETQNSSDA